MSIGNVNIPDNQGSSFVAIKNPVALQDGKIKLDLSAKDYQLRARLDTLIKSGAIKVDGDPGQFISDVLEGAKEAKAHGDNSVTLDDVALADFTQDNAACASRLGGNRPTEVNPFKQTVDQEAYAMINKQTNSPEPSSRDNVLAKLAKIIDPIKNLDIHI